jgi:hypothetical protein
MNEFDPTQQEIDDREETVLDNEETVADNATNDVKQVEANPLDSESSRFPADQLDY